jgi:hypothetical protein
MWFCIMRAFNSAGMKITQDVRAYDARQKEIEAGMQEKFAAFRQRGGEVYLRTDVGDAADAEETVAAD